MKVKLLRGEDLQRVENNLNDFIIDKKVKNIKLYKFEKTYIFLIIYYDIL